MNAISIRVRKTAYEMCKELKEQAGNRSGVDIERENNNCSAVRLSRRRIIQFKAFSL
jgi:hypothetical protein